MIVGLTGSFASGKGVVGDFLKEKGFVYLSLSDELRELCNKRGLEVTRENLQNLGNEMREKEGSGFLAKLVVKKIKENNYANVVVDGIRNPGEILELRGLDNFVLVAVDASREIRFKRVVERNREKDPKTWEEFLVIDNRDLGIGEKESGQAVEVCIKQADYRISNESNLEDTKKKVYELFGKIFAKDKISKRKDYLGWDEYFMGIALLSAQRSKDPSTQVGACIVNKDKKIIGIGYNGFPIGCSDDELPWEREGQYVETKYAYVCHAELNAILNSMGKDLKDCAIYVGLFPCNECAKAIIQSGIKEVVYLEDKYADTDLVKASKIMFNQAGVRYRKFFPNVDRIEIGFSL